MPILDWIFEGIVDWVAGVVAKLMDAVSGLFLEALGTDMTAMEEYFPFVSKAYGVMQVLAYAMLILIVIWQIFRAFGGPITESENPWHLVVRGSIFGFLIGYAKPIFTLCLDIARAPYTSLLELSLTGEDFTFAGVEKALSSGLATTIAVASVVGMFLILILVIALGWNYFKLLLETVERYIVVGVLCYTSPLHPLMVFCMAKPLEGSMVTLNKRSNEMNLRSVLGSHFVNEDFGCYNYRATHWLDTEMNQHRFFEILDRCCDEAVRGYLQLAS